MGLYKLPKLIDIDRKPSFGTRINWHHPLSQRLVGAWLFNEGGGNNVYDNYGSNGLAYGSTLWKPQGCYFDGGASGAPANNYINMGHSIRYDLTDGWTVVYGIMILTIPTGPRFIVGKDVNVGRSYCFGYTLYTGSTLHPYYEINGNPFEQSFSIYINNYYQITFKQTNSSSCSCYVNGGLVTTGVSATPNITTTDLLFGRRGYTGYEQASDALCYHFYMFNRALSETEIVSLHANPYQMFEWPVGDYYFVTEAAPTSLSIPVAMYHLRQQGIS